MHPGDYRVAVRSVRASKPGRNADMSRKGKGIPG